MKISDVADIINVTEKDPSNCGIDVFVGLEHYDIAEPVIKRFGSTKMLTTATKKFEAGDVLIARRNVYLQRASLARFSGLTSGDSIILRVKKNLCSEKTDYDTMCKLLPFILNSINFWDYANTNADGTMSKRLSPAMLLEYEFDLPSIEEQKVLAEKLWAAYEVKQSYLKMIDATEEMVKSRFVEMFGNPITNPKGWKLKRLEELYTVSSSKRIYAKELCSDGLIPFLKVSDIIDLIENGAFEHSTSITEQRYNELLEMGQVPKADDILITSRGTIGKCYIVKALDKFYFQDGMITWLKQCKGNDIESAFFVSLFQSQEFAEIIKGITNKTTVTYVSLEKLSKIAIPVPPLALQIKFLAIAEQADKSISELRKSIDAIDKVIKSLINENL